MKNKILEYISLITTMIIVGCLSFHIISATYQFIRIFVYDIIFNSHEIFKNMMKVLLNVVGYDLIRIILIIVLIFSHLILFNKIKWKIRYSNIIYTLMIYTVLICIVNVFKEINYYYYPSLIISNILVLLMWLFTFLMMLIWNFKSYCKLYILLIITLFAMGSSFIIWSLQDMIQYYYIIQYVISGIHNFILVFLIYFMALNIITFNKTKYNKLVSIIFKVFLIVYILINFNYSSTIYITNNVLIIVSLITLIVCTFIKKTTEQQ